MSKSGTNLQEWRSSVIRTHYTSKIQRPLKYSVSNQQSRIENRQRIMSSVRVTRLGQIAIYLTCNHAAGGGESWKCFTSIKYTDQKSLKETL